MIDEQATSSPSRGQRKGGALAAPILAVWVLGAGIVGGSWALHRAETSLESNASELAIVVQSRAHGASIDWNGRTANLSPGSLDAQATDDLVNALAGLDGVANVKIVDVGSLAAAVSLPTTVIAGATTGSTALEPATTSSTTTEPATTTPSTTTSSTEPPTTEADTPTTSTTSVNDAAAHLEQLLAGRTIEFVFSTAVPTPETEALLDELTSLLEANPDLILHITGHTDPAGNEPANQLLSEARAQSIANHLIIRGIDAARMTTSGKGSTEPIADNVTSAGKQQNRRVVIEAVEGETT